MAEKSGVIKGSMLLGLIWGGWHAPLWFVTSGFTAVDLVIYIASFLVLIVSISVIIGICYKHNKNILVPIWIHLMLNFSMSLYAGGIEDAIDLTIYIMLLYVPTDLDFICGTRKSPLLFKLFNSQFYIFYMFLGIIILFQ